MPAPSYNALIDIWLACALECRLLLDGFVEDDPFGSMLLECWGSCRRAMKAMTCGSPRADVTYLECCFACDACGDACELRVGKPFRRCAAACRRCMAACWELAVRPEPCWAWDDEVQPDPSIWVPGMRSDGRPDEVTVERLDDRGLDEMASSCRRAVPRCRPRGSSPEPVPDRMACCRGPATVVAGGAMSRAARAARHALRGTHDRPCALRRAAGSTTIVSITASVDAGMRPVQRSGSAMSSRPRPASPSTPSRRSPRWPCAASRGGRRTPGRGRRRPVRPGAGPRQPWR